MILVRIILAFIFIGGAFGGIDYTLFRWIVFIGLGILILEALKDNVYNIFYLLPLFTFLILFNPLIPFYFYSQTIWIYLDFAAAAFLLLYFPFLSLFIKDESNDNNLSESQANIPDWVDYPEHKRKKYLDNALKYDPLLGEQNHKIDYDEIRNSALALVDIPYIGNNQEEKIEDSDGRVDKVDSDWAEETRKKVSNRYPNFDIESELIRLNHEASTPEERSYNERKLLILEWKWAEYKLEQDNENSIPIKYQYLTGKKSLSNILSPEQFAGYYLDEYWNNALDNLYERNSKSKKYVPQTTEYWDKVTELISSAVGELYFCRRCKRNMKKNPVYNMCNNCREESALCSTEEERMEFRKKLDELYIRPKRRSYTEVEFPF